MNETYLISGPLVDRLGETLLHFLWQGALILVVYVAVRRLLFNGSGARSRYALACSTMAIMVAAPLITLIVIPTKSVSDGAQLLSDPITILAANVSAPTDGSSLLIPYVDARNSVLAVVVTLWLVGAMAFWARLMGGWLISARMRFTQVRTAPQEWQQLLGRLGTRIGITQRVELLVSGRVFAPTVVGWLRPLVLMPVGALSGLPPAQLEALLAHELAHIRRHDYLVNILQSVAEALLFYHPAVWWVSGQIRAEREFCCDDVAVAITGDAVTYARALTEVASVPRPGLNVPVAAAGGSLVTRIGRLLGDSRHGSPIRPGPSVVLSAALLLVLSWAMYGQTPERLEFAEASIDQVVEDPVDTRSTGELRTNPEGRLTANRVLLTFLIQQAYGVRRYQITGGPAWIQNALYNIEADAGQATGEAEMMRMLQALLEDRLGLEVHRETQVLPSLRLTVAEGGHKLQPPANDGCYTPSPNSERPAPPRTPDEPFIGPCGRAGFALSSIGRMAAGRVDMSEVARVLSNLLGQTVIDATGLTDLYDAPLTFAIDDSLSGLPGGRPPDFGDGSGVSIFIAIREQLGLEIEGGGSPTELLVIDSIRMP